VHPDRPQMKWRKNFRKTEEISEIHGKELMGTVFRKLLKMQETDFYSDRKCNLIFILDKYINVLGDNVEK